MREHPTPTMAIGFINRCITFLNLSPSNIEPQQPFFLLIAMLFDAPPTRIPHGPISANYTFPALTQGFLKNFLSF